MFSFWQYRHLLFDLLFPVECISCGRKKEWFCSECQELINFEPQHRCPGCDTFSFLGKTCQKCRQHLNIRGIFSYNSYSNFLLRRLIHYYKYYYLTDLEEQLISIYAHIIFNIKKAQALGKLPLIINEQTIFIPVPLHPRKLRQRSFNQSEQLLRGLAKRGIIDDKQININLQRIRYSSAQAKLPFSYRRRNIYQAFSYRGGDDLKGMTVILCDDVAASGQTINECARILKKQGAKNIWALVLAQG